MDLQKANSLATSLMETNGLTQKGWKFKFDNAVKRFGYCSSKGIISVSAPLTAVNSEAEVKNTILHEIAHAIAGNHHDHDNYWQTVCKNIGGDGKRCYGSEVVKPSLRYKAVCSTCNKEFQKARLSRLASIGLRRYACTACCKINNNGRYDERFRLEYKDSSSKLHPMPKLTFDAAVNVGQVS